MVNMTVILVMKKMFHDGNDGDYHKIYRNEDNNRVFDTNFY